MCVWIAQKVTILSDCKVLCSCPGLLYCLHCNENPIYSFLFWELRGLRPKFHIHVSVRDLYKPRIGPHIFLQQSKQIDRGNI
jgi:hypothetical protein